MGKKSVSAEKLTDDCAFRIAKGADHSVLSFLGTAALCALFLGAFTCQQCYPVL